MFIRPCIKYGYGVFASLPEYAFSLKIVQNGTYCMSAFFKPPLGSLQRPNCFQHIKNNDSSGYATPIQYNAEYRKFEIENSEVLSCADTVSEEGSDREPNCFGSCREDDAVSEISADGDSEDETTGDKYLIFTTGYKTYTPHQIGTYTTYSSTNCKSIYKFKFGKNWWFLCQFQIWNRMVVVIKKLNLSDFLAQNFTLNVTRKKLHTFLTLLVTVVLPSNLDNILLIFGTMQF